MLPAVDTRDLPDLPVIDLYEDTWVRIVADGNMRVVGESSLSIPFLVSGTARVALLQPAAWLGRKWVRR